MDDIADQQILNLFKQLGISESDLTEQFVRSGGKGGQNVNKVSSCVILTHRPSGITVRCEEERSQARNRVLARIRLAERIKFVEKMKKLAEQQTLERHRRQKRTRNRKAKETILRSKHHRKKIKQNRRAPSHDE